MFAELHDLSNPQIARVLMRQLWQGYDAGGISMGRSPEARLLEAAMKIVPLPFVVTLERFTPSYIIRESKKIINNTQVCSNQMLLQPDQIEFFGSDLLAFFLLCKLCRIYIEKLSSNEYTLPSWELNIINTAIEFLLPDIYVYQISPLSPEKLIEEANRRAGVALKEKHRQIDNFDLIVQ